MTIWQQDFAQRKPLFLLAANFRCADDRLGNGENGLIADGHGTATKLNPPERSYSRSRRQPNKEGATESVGAPVSRSGTIPRDAVSP
jgi:hypothetical protein